ncbi:MAG: SPOR domain-containing protein [Rhodospirillaceae bacterium]|nr:SPOR domain-containing protein [Rhodospirillaceae bacterium]
MKLRSWLIAGLPLVLAGCIPALPLTLSLASSGMTGVSLLTTGKTTTDHVISATRNENCAMIRLAIGEPICRAYKPGEHVPDTVTVTQYPGNFNDPDITSVAMVEGVEIRANPDDFKESASTQDFETVFGEDMAQMPAPPAVLGVVSGFAGTVASEQVEPITIAALVKDKAPVERRVEPISHWVVAQPLQRIAPSRAIAKDVAISRDLPSGQAETGRYVILGSFRPLDRARDLAQRVDHLEPNIMRVHVGGQPWYRVAVGPMSASAASQMKGDIRRIDGKAPWTTRLTQPVPLMTR